MDSSSVMAELRDKNTRQKIENWASAWWDLRTAGQMIHSIELLPTDDGHVHLFTKKAIIDGAIAAYGRHFVDGTRRAVVDLLPIIKSFGPEAESTHEQAFLWRNKNVAHRGLEADWESIQTYIVWPDRNKNEGAFIRSDITVSLGPSTEFTKNLSDLCEKLANYIWENKLTSTRIKYVSASKNSVKLKTIRQYRSSPWRPVNNEGTDRIVTSLSI